MDRTARALSRLTSQEVARGNAAIGAAELKQRLDEQEDVDRYLAQRRWRYSTGVNAARHIEAPSAR